MLQRGRSMLLDRWKEKLIMPRDQTGRFNLDEAAAELSLDPNYVRALYKPKHYTFAVKSSRYPGERGRSTRPGGVSSSMNHMFPLYKRDSKLHRQLRTVPNSRFSTF